MSDSISVVEKLLAKHIEGEKQQEVVIERIEEYKLAVNRIASMNEGKLLFKYMLKFNSLFADDAQLNPAKLIEDKGKRAYYLKLIRPYLDPKLRMEIEGEQ